MPYNKETAAKAGSLSSRKGIPNKSTSKTRDAFNELIEKNLENLSIWIAQVAADDPKAALEVIAKLAEYTTPKLARTETKLDIEDRKQFTVEEVENGKDE